MIKMIQRLQPTITFIMLIQNKEDFLVEQIATMFGFSEHYPGFCEIIIIGDRAGEAAVKLAWLALTLNKIKHPHVRTKMIRYTSELNINDLLQTGLNHALGQKIIIVTNDSEKIEMEKITDMGNRDIHITQYVFDENVLEETESSKALRSR